MKRTLLFLSLFVVIALPVLAQETFRIGDMVETADGRQCTIESITGSSAKVKCGPNRSDIRVYSFQSLIGAKTAKLRREQQQQQTQTPVSSQTAVSKSAQGEQNTFRVGDRVAVEGTNQEGVIESITENGAKVKFGPGKYDFKYFLFKDLISPQAAVLARERQQQELTQKPIRAQFENEAEPFRVLVRGLAHAYDPKFRQDAVSITDKPETYEKWRKDLESLSAICQKYPTLTNRPGADADNISQNPADWCKLAEQRTAVINKMKATVGGQYAGTAVQSWTNKINSALRDRKGYVKDELQMLLYDRAAWEQKELQKIRKTYSDAGETMPSDLLASLDEKVNELKAQIERDAPTRSWEQPPYTDAALEGMARRAYPAQSPGVKVFKTGMTFTTWKSMDDTSLVGQGSDYKLYRTTKGAYRYKLGLALVKLPNQPFCQIRDFQVQQDKAGAGYSAARLHLPLGYTGIFVKCP